MSRLYKATFSLLFIMSGLLAGHRGYAEGSKDLYPSGIAGGRAFLVSTTGTKTGWTLTNMGVHYAYLKAGETLGAASSAQGIGSGQIILTAPDGTVYTSTAGTTTVGQIANRTQELQGPWVGYTPFSQVVGAGQAGVWKIELVSTNPPANIAEGAGANVAADAAWTQNTASSAIAAWDISVRSAGGTIIPGRVYTNVLNMFVDFGNYRGVIYVLTKDGYVYKVNNNGSSGIGFVAFVNNKGLTTNATDAGEPLYKSVAGTNRGTDFNVWDPRSDDGTYSVTHKMFYHVPATDMPASSVMPGGKTTWLRGTKIIPAVTNISVDGVEGTAGQVSKKGAYIKFTASVGGTYRISLVGTGSFVTKQITGTAVAGNNSIFWDGKDGAGVTPALGTASVTANIQLQGAEIHFPFIDVENNPNGLIIEQLNDDNTVKSDIVYWDDASFATATGASNPRSNGNSGSGISSNTNGHKWSNNYGDVKTMDTWTYVLGDMASRNTTLNIVEADLAIQSVGPATPLTQVTVGKTVTYKVVVVNNGPSDVTGAPFAIKVPAGFTVADLSAVTASTSCGTVKNAALDASGNYTALLDLPNGCIVTFNLTGTAGPSLAGGNINIETSIMRPKDVTDPDATNPNAAVPPTDPHVECKNGGTTENCNNIKYNSGVAVVASADIVVVKTTQDATKTTYAPGETVNYVITVTNNGPSTATNVNVTDVAPAGTTIGAWTATAAGPVALPHTSGTGNINETIATIPAGETVTYVVQVTLPAGYNSALSNTASASGPVLDETPGNNTSTTTPITLEPGADIAAVKVVQDAAKTTYAPGEDVIYTITVTNNGPADAKDVNIKDVAPAGTIIRNWTASVITGTVSPLTASGMGDIDQLITSMSNGAVVRYVVTVGVPADHTGNLSNTATVTTGSRDDVPGNNNSTSGVLTPAPKADVAVVKTTAVTSFTPGQDVVYTITVTNNGPSDAKDVNVSDIAPAGTTISAWSAAVTTGTVTLPNASGTGNLNETIATLPDGAVVTYTVTVSIPASLTASLSNTATATSSTPDDNQANNSGTATTIVPAPKADVSVAKTTAATKFTPGQNVVYTIIVTNNGPSDAENVNISDIAPAGTTISAWTAAVTTGTVTLPNTSGTGNLNETIATLPDGAVVTYTVTVSVPASFTATISNTANVTSSTPDDDQTDNSSTAPAITPAAIADIVTAKKLKDAGQTSFVPGEDVVYVITVANNGPSDAKNVNVNDVAPAGTVISAWSATVTTGTVTLPNTSGTGNLNETIATLPNGAVVTYEVTVKTPASFSGSLSNTAVVTSTTTDPTPGNNNNTSSSTTPTPKADVSVVKTTAATNFTPGQDVVYTITVTNNGPSDAKDVNVSDVAPAGTTISAWSAAVTTGTVTLPNTSGSGNLNETIATLADGAVVTYTVTVSIPASLTASLSNTATATSSTPDDNQANNSGTATTIVPSPKADVSVAKTTAATNFTPGQDVVYTITVTNNGPSDAKDVNVSDIAPAGTTISAWTAAVTTGTVTLPNTSGSGNLNETIATLADGAVVTYTVTVSVPASSTATISNTANVTSTTPDDDQTDNSSTTPAISPTAIADIVTVKKLKDGSQTSFVPGQDVVYVITVANNGPSDAKNVNVNDVAPAGTTISAWSAAVTTGTASLPNTSGTGNLNETISTLPNGAVVTYEVTVKTPASFSGSLSNTAVVTSTTTDPTPGNNNNTSSSTTPTPKADVSVMKTTTATSFTPGQNVVYTITVTNNGPSDAKDVNVSDVAPAGTTISAWSAAVTAGTVTLPNTSGSGNLNETIATLPDGAVVTYTVTVSVPASFTASLSNTATATSTNPDDDQTDNTSTAPVITPAAIADIVTLKKLKDASQTTFVPGQDVVYVITVTNNGPSDAKTVNIKDDAPNGTTISAWNAAVTTGTVALPNTSGTGNLNETIATLPNGAVVTYEVTVKTPASFSGSLSNTAVVTSTTTDPTPGNNSNTSSSVTPASKADVSVVKTTAATSFTPGQNVVYTITVTNNGPSDAKTVNIKDNAPTGTTISSWTATVTTGTVSLPNTSGTGNLNETIATLSNGAVVTYTVTVAVPASYVANLSNTATVTTSSQDDDQTDNSSTTPAITPAAIADIVTVKKLKDASQTTFVPGEDVVYVITVTNNGPSDAKTVNIKDDAPAGTSISAWSATVKTGTVTLPSTSGTGNLNETIATLPNGAVVTYEVTVKTPADFTGTLSNSAAVQSSTPDAAPGNNTSTTPGINPTPVVGADIVTVKRLKDAAQTTFVAGQEVAYVITVTNNGPGDAAKVNIKDIAPAGTTISSWTATVTNGTVALPHTSGSGDIDETIAVMPNAAVVTYEVKVLTPEGFTGSLVNVAAVTSETPDPAPACPACAAAPVTPEPLPVAATDNHGDVRADNPVTIPVLSNDTPGNPNTPLDPASLEIVQQPAHGSIVVNEDGTVVYTPEKGYTGPDSFTYKVKDQHGNWSNVATVNLNIIPNEVEVPNVITPNGDGSNDKLVIKGLEKFVQNEIVIYNRWNNVLFRKQNYQGEWDGQGLNAGTYYYTLKGLDANGQWHTYNGYIMLLR
ncbi:gliding motility-associated C-terminal domain-containing protein [Chitinophaga filiformis]|uniref:Gliding motility-associated C-terminal domain-containing protein n=1 Tax=Chitinophaga filiformis TaxID=104663 RepID=A0ABY4HXS7_CHIFI|nr:gliding motility-associated C-terminal domain-containing protein [Chitinophaga filiformis]UPK68190.1 gliding motility-associated C-terminal domain-containing protein [Chitinophaga filiformis]